MNRRQEEEFVLGSAVQARKEELLALLNEAEKKTRRKWGSEPASTFEDAARDVIDMECARSEPVARALSAFQAAVNDFWTWAIREEMPKRIARRWMQANRRRVQEAGLTIDVVTAEVYFELRKSIVAYLPKEGGRGLESFASPFIYGELNAWAGKLLSSNEIPYKLAAHRKSQDRVELRDDSFTSEGNRRGCGLCGKSHTLKQGKF